MTARTVPGRRSELPSEDRAPISAAHPHAPQTGPDARLDALGVRMLSAARFTLNLVLE